MRIRTSIILRMLAAIVAWINLLVVDAVAQDYPVKPIRIILGAAAGGSLDATARIIAQKLSEQLGQPVIVEVRPGASGTIANDRVAKSPPDGYTLLVMAATGAVQSALRTNLPYDLERDFAPVSLLTITPLVLVVHPSVPARNVKELIALARRQPGKLNYGSSGLGSTSHLAGEAINLMANVKIVHIPYKGGAESVVAAASGQVDMSLPGITSVPALADAGKVRALAVTTRDRAPLMPSVPTLSESGFPGYDFSSWAGLLAPAGVPKHIIERLNALVIKATNVLELKEAFHRQGMSVRSTTSQQFTEFIQRELALNRKLIKAVGLRTE